MPEAPPSRSLPKTIFGSGEGFAYLMLERSGWLVVTRNCTRNPAKASPERGGARRSGRRGSLGSRLRRSRHPSKAPSPLPHLTSRNTVRTGTYAAPRYSPAYGQCCGTRSRWSRRKWYTSSVSSSGMRICSSSSSPFWARLTMPLDSTCVPSVSISLALRFVST